jgi:hypothetical protein
VQIRRHCATLATVAVMISLPVLGMSGVASAKAPGCHKTHSCTRGGTTGGATGSATTGPITIQIDPNPLVETGPSDILGTIQVETSPSLAGDPVDISSSQLNASCEMVQYLNPNTRGNGSVTVILDDDGNAAVGFYGGNCAPGTDTFEADLAVAPYYTALGVLTASPPVVTTAGVTGYPSTSGTVTTGEVETGDSAASGDSDVSAVFYVETDPVYAEQPVEISSAQLEASCGAGWLWQSVAGIEGQPTGTVTGTGVNMGESVQGVLDDDGNAVFVFFGSSCAATASTVIADVEAGSHPTYTTTFNVVAPQPTI